MEKLFFEDIWRNYFLRIYGERSLFKNMKEALGENISLIQATETGLSADPCIVIKIL